MNNLYRLQLVDGEHGPFFRLEHGNGQPIMTSEIYSSPSARDAEARKVASAMGLNAVLGPV